MFRMINGITIYITKSYLFSMATGCPCVILKISANMFNYF